MRDSLNVVLDLQQRYVEISEYKKVACIDIEKAFPELVKTNSDKKSQFSGNEQDASDEELDTSL
jgi:hypothetical protein